MSCDGHRNLYFSQAGNTPGGDFSADDLDRVYQAGRNRPAKNPTEQIIAEAKTRLLFADMQAAGIKPPTHSKNGLPKKDAQMGYAATYDYLQAKGYFAKGGSAQFDQQATKQLLDAEHGHAHPEGEHEHEEESQPASEPGSGAQQCPKCGQFMGEDHVCAAADESTEQGEEPGAVFAKPAPKAKRKKGSKADADKDQAALEADADMSKEVPPEKIEALATQSLEGVRLGGMDEADTHQSARFPVWQYIPRCGRCGRFMSTRNPVCNNPKCGMAGKKQHDPIDWPPAGAAFKKSRRRQPTQEDYAANRALPKATIKIQGRDGSEKEVTLERITDDRQVEYSEYVNAHVPIKGIGFTDLANVVEWEGQPSRRRRKRKTEDVALAPPGKRTPLGERPAWAKVGQKVRISTDGKEGYIVKVQRGGGYAEISSTPGGTPTRVTVLENIDPVEEPAQTSPEAPVAPVVEESPTDAQTTPEPPVVEESASAGPQIGAAHPIAAGYALRETQHIPDDVNIKPTAQPRYDRGDQNDAITAAARASMHHGQPYYVFATANGYKVSDSSQGVNGSFVMVNGRRADLYTRDYQTTAEAPAEPEEAGPGVQKCPKCGQFMGKEHTCPPTNLVGMLNSLQALPRADVSRVYREVVDSADPAYLSNRDDFAIAVTALYDLHDIVDSGSAELVPEKLDVLQRQLYAYLERNPEVAGMLSRGLSQMESKDIAAAVALSGEDAGPGVEKCPRCGQFMGQDHACSLKDVKAYGWSQVKEWALEQDRQNGNNGYNFFAAYSLMEGNYQQVIQDAHRGKITADRAIEIVDRLGEVGAITESNRLWYAEQINRARPPETPPAPAPAAEPQQYRATFQSQQNGQMSVNYWANNDTHAAWQAKSWARVTADQFGDKITVDGVAALATENQPSGAKRITAEEYAGLRRQGRVGRNNGQTHALYETDGGNMVFGPVEVVSETLYGPGAQKCPKCGQFMGEDHVCPVTDEEPEKTLGDYITEPGDTSSDAKADQALPPLNVAEYIPDEPEKTLGDTITDPGAAEQPAQTVPEAPTAPVVAEPLATPAGVPPRRDTVPFDEWEGVLRAAMDWKYLTVAGGGMARKSDLDEYLMAQYNLSQMGARNVSNSLDEYDHFRTGEGSVTWNEVEAGRPAPKWEDHPELAPPGGYMEGAKLLQKCPKCGQFMGEDHVCPPTAEEIEQQRLASLPPLHAITDIALKRGDGWAGNKAMEGEFVVDGFALLVADDIKDRKLQEQLSKPPRGMEQTVTQETVAGIYHKSDGTARIPAEVYGYVDKPAEDDYERALIVSANGDVRAVDARKLARIGASVDYAQVTMSDERGSPIVFRKEDGRAVALLMPLYVDDDKLPSADDLVYQRRVLNGEISRTVGAEPSVQLKPAVNQNPNGTFSVVGTVPQYLADLVFENQDLAQMALDESNAVLQRGEGAVSPAFRAAWQQTQDTGNKLVRAEDLESVARRCGNCGAFMPAEGPCNNPKCPSHNPVETPAVAEAPAEAVEAPIEQPVAVAAAQAPEAPGVAPAPVKTAAPPKDFGFRFGEGSSHTYIPKWMKDHIPPIGSTQNDDNPYAVIKLFTPDSNWTWYVTEYDGKDTCFGLVAGHETEWGYFSLSEISSVRGPLGLRIEREMFTEPTRVKALREYKEAWGGDYEEAPEAPAEPVAPVLTEEIKSTPITPQTYTIRAEPDPLMPDKQVYRAYDTNGNPLDIGGDTPAEVDERLRQSLPVTDVVLEGDATGPGSQKCPKCGRFMGEDHVCPVTEEVDETEADLSVPVDEPVPDVVDPFAVEEEPIVDEAPRGPDYTISDADEVGKGGAKTKARSNVAAVRLVKQLEDDGRMATPEEQAILVKFVGWGGLPQVFDWKNETFDKGWLREGKPEFYDEWKELKGLLSEEEWDAARKSTMNAHYTSPTVVRGVWKALEHMGFDRTNGLVLEPAAGIGHFFGLMPEKFKKCRKVGVELDPFTARIAKHLYQGAEVQNCGFEDAALPDDFVDLAISNVPFGAYGVVDKEFRGPLKFLSKSIHNFFFAKALRKVKPGGVVAFITSRYTLDSQDTQIREHLAKDADLVGAIRLPNTAFKENAGTEVTTDIIFLRKRGKGEPPSDTSWVDTQKVIGADGNEIRVNDYFAEHPEMMLGNLQTTGTMYGRGEVTLESDGREISEALDDAISRLPADALAAPAGHCPQCGGFMGRDGTCHNPNCHTKRPLTRQPRMASRERKENEFVVGEDGQLYRVRSGQLLSPDDPAFIEVDDDGKPKKKGKADPMGVQRARGMVEVNAVARKLLQLNANQGDDDALQATQAELTQVYDAFVAKYGPINSKPNRNALLGDPNLPFLLALEDGYNPETNTVQKTAIFTKRTIAINKVVESAESPADALRVALDEGGVINWARMATLTGRPAETLQRALLLQGAVYQAPDGTWQTSEEYLSGNVREKLRQAQAAAKLDPRYQRNVDALQAAMPRDLEAGEIKATLGSAWIPTDDVRAFAKHIFDGVDFAVEYNPAMAEWAVKPESTGGRSRWDRSVFDRNSANNKEIWGTGRVDALTLLKQALNAQTPTVWDEVDVPGGGTKRVVNQDATIAAREAQSKIKKEFEKWLFTDPERAERLLKKYNEEFNSEVPREYDGTHLTLPGMGATMPDLREHQKNAIWRVTQGGNTLLAHVVGAGKTFTMIGGGMELRRMGLRKKVMHVVPNHCLEQYTADVYRMYPAANVLMLASGDLTPEKRAETMSRVATGDYDAVVVTHSAFAKLPVSVETQTRYLREQLDDLEEALEAAKADGEKITVKKMEKAKAKYEAKIKGLQADMAAKQDQTITWDDLGVDQLFVDEADTYKNLDFPTRRNVSGVKGASSQRAFDMYTKIRAMGDKFGHGKGVCFATGTPIANSVSEMYNMQRYLDYQNLKDKGLAHFDAWANQFGETVTSIEMRPSGGGYQTKERFAQFNNVPELKRMFMRTGDIRIDPEELGLKRPKMMADEKGDRRQRGVVAPSTPELKSYIASLVERADNLGHVDPRDDNMLKITGDGRKAALDMRLVDPDADDNPDSKLNKCVAGVFDVYQRTTGVEVPGQEGKQNMAQMVFCDLGTPAARAEGKFCVYDDIKAKLMARGIPEEEIAFMQDHKSDEAKFELFQNVNAGKVRVLIGSTDTMGSGTNAQRRLAAMHHLDAPWRPRDIDQREGRILRQGNMNEEVEINRYLTEGSFDVYNWQLLERKSRFIGQVMNRSLNERSVEDIDAQALTYAEMKALATGNPAVIERVAVDTELRKLNALEAAAKSRGHSVRAKLEKLPQDIAHSRAALRGAEEAHAAVTRAQEAEEAREAKIKQDIEKARTWARETAKTAKEADTPENREKAENAKAAADGLAARFKRNGAFKIHLNGKDYDEREDAGKALVRIENDLMSAGDGKDYAVGEYQGFPLIGRAPQQKGDQAKFFVKITDQDAQQVQINTDFGRTFDAKSDGTLHISRLHRVLDRPAKNIEEHKSKIAGYESELATLQGAAGGGFEHQERLEYLRKRALELDEILAGLGSDKQVLGGESSAGESSDDE